MPFLIRFFQTGNATIDLQPMQNNQLIFESLFNRNYSDSGNIELLEQITEAHPYFSPARFFLLQKTKQDSAAFEKELAKTNIQFNNPHWLNFQLQQTDKNKSAADYLSKSITNVLNEQQVEEDIAEEPVQHAAAPQPENIAENVVNIAEDKLKADDEPDNTEANGQMEAEIEPMNIELKMPEENLNLDEAMLFEPMHVVDYFASQGIKLTDEVQMADKLGKQLKSFTEWLKTMKKVHLEEAEGQQQNDTSIATMAENSNAKAEVLTEAMAEVFVKQGKMGKAGEVYKKLSLLNPAKSAYFAAKLENLKES